MNAIKPDTLNNLWNSAWAASLVWSKQTPGPDADKLEKSAKDLMDVYKNARLSVAETEEVIKLWPQIEVLAAHVRARVAPWKGL